MSRNGARLLCYSVLPCNTIICDLANSALIIWRSTSPMGWLSRLFWLMPTLSDIGKYHICYILCWTYRWIESHTCTTSQRIKANKVSALVPTYYTLDTAMASLPLALYTKINASGSECHWYHVHWPTSVGDGSVQRCVWRCLILDGVLPVVILLPPCLPPTRPSSPVTPCSLSRSATTLRRMIAERPQDARSWWTGRNKRRLVTDNPPCRTCNVMLLLLLVVTHDETVLMCCWLNTSSRCYLSVSLLEISHPTL